mgnify:CR=1 FL=1
MAHNIAMEKEINERLRKRASQHFLDSIAVKQEAEKVLPESVAKGVLAMVDCLRAGGKVMACGNGGSAADAQHIAAEFVGRFLVEARTAGQPEAHQRAADEVGPAGGQALAEPVAHAAAALGVDERQSRRWIAGDSAIPESVAKLLRLMIDHKIKPDDVR